MLKEMEFGTLELNQEGMSFVCMRELGKYIDTPSSMHS